MLPQFIALGAILRNKLAEEGLVPEQKPLCRELSLDDRLDLINRNRAYHGGSPITEDDYLSDERRWVTYLKQSGLVRPSWMKNVY